MINAPYPKKKLGSVAAGQAGVSDGRIEPIAPSASPDTLVDFDRLSAILTSLSQVTGLPVTISDIHIPCLDHEIIPFGEMRTDADVAVYRRPGGLTYCVVPLVADGKHIANLTTGMFMLEPQERSALEEAEQLRTPTGVPIIAQARLPAILDLIAALADQAAQFGLARLQVVQAKAEIEQKVIERTYRLSESEARLNKAQHIARIGSWELDAAQHRLSWSAETYRIFGMARAEFGGTFEDGLGAIHPDDRDRVRRTYASSLEAGGQFESEFRIIRKSDGRLRWGHAYCEHVRDAKGKVLYSIGTVQDITDHKQALEKLRKSEHQLRESQAAAKLGNWELDVISQKLDWSDQTYALYDESPETFTPTYEELARRIHPDDRETMQTRFEQALASDSNPYHVVLRIINESGRQWVMEAFGAVTRDTDGKPLHVHGTAQDITERKRNEDIQSARMHLMEVAGSRSLKELLVAALDEAGKLTESPIGFYHFLEADQKTLSLQAWSTLTTQKFCTAAGEGRHYDIDEAGVWVECVRERRPVIHNDYASLENKRGLPPGHAQVIREMVVPVFRKGKIVAILGVGNKSTPYGDSDLDTVTKLADQAWDFAESKLANEALRESEERWKFALESSGAGVWDWDIPTGEMHFSTRWKAMLGYTDDKVVGRVDGLEKLIHPDDLAQVHQTLYAYLNGDIPEFVTEYRIRCMDGHWKWILSRGMIVRRSPDGEPVRMVGTHSDITERKEDELQIAFVAYHDHLTGLPNRSLFFDRFSQAITQARRNDRRVALIYVDLDAFKPVNDNYGHSIGDIVLKIVAERLLSSVRAIDTVARIGGDEFVVTLGDLGSPDEAEPVARKLLHSLEQKISLPGDQQCQIGASIGIGIYPDNGTEIDTLLAAADTAMYQSKHAGKGKITFSDNPATSATNVGEWIHFDSQYRLGIDEIDQQHRQLFSRLNHLNELIQENPDPAKLRKELDNLIEYTRLHFETEDKLMVLHDYPGRISHELEHAHLLADAMHFKIYLNRGGDLFVLQSIKDWLLRHLLTEDKRLGEFLKGRLRNSK